MSGESPGALASETAAEPVDPISDATASTDQGEQEAKSQAGDTDAQTKTLTQEEVDKIVKARLAKEHRRHQKELSDARSQADAYRQLLDSRASDKPAGDAPQGGGEPKRDAYETYEDFIEARAEWRAERATERKLAEAREAAAKRQEVDRIQTLERQFSERESAAREKYDDYDDVVRSVRGLPKHVVEYIGEAEAGPDVLYALASDPQVLEKVMSLSPVAAMRELARIEVDAQAKSTPKAVSKAPAPVRTISAKSSAADGLPSDSDDVETWRRKELERMRKAGRLR